MMEDRWLSVDEIAAYLGIKRDTAYKWISERQMPGHKIGRLWKFRKEEIDGWVRSGGAGGDEESASATAIGQDSSTAVDKQRGKAILLTRKAIMTFLDKNRDELHRRFSVRRIGLFGSINREGADSQSDVDLLVELDEPTFDHYMELKFFLEEHLNRSVDLVLSDTVKARLKPLLSQEVKYA
jgi:excisionase family DNA binding protein